jgi:hypothetical protein
VSGAVVGNEKFPIAKGLVEHGVDRLAKILQAIEHR